MLTFEMIRELERQEKANRKLQKLPENLKEELRDYIKRKEKIAEKTTADIMELENVKNTIKRFFEMRERKIVEMALAMASTGLPPENLGKAEEEIFYGLVESVKSYREKFFADIGREAKEEENGKTEIDESKEGIGTPEGIGGKEGIGTPEGIGGKEWIGTPERPEGAEKIKENKERVGRVIYRVKREVQEFVGPDMNTYRLIKGEIVNLPKPLNDLLLKEGVIEEIQE